MSVSPLANNRCTTIFHWHEQGVISPLMCRQCTKIQGCRNETGLWTVPLIDEATISQSFNVNEAAMNVYDLPSNKDRTSKKQRLLSAEHSLNGNLIMTFQSSPTITFARSFKSQMQMRLRKSKPIITHHLVKELEIIWSKEWTRSNMIIFQLVQGIDMKSFRLSVRGFEGTILTSITQIEKVY